MRTREEIERYIGPNDPQDTNWVYAEDTNLIVELLLDIRDLLAQERKDV